MNNRYIRFLNFTLIALTISSITVTQQQPKGLSLDLYDSYIQNPQYSFGSVLKRGLIMYTLYTNNDLLDDLKMIYAYMNIPYNNTLPPLQQPRELPQYQAIVESLKITTKNTEAIATIEAFEKAIMKLLHYEHYIYYSEGRWSNMFFTGIRKTWFSPSDWINISTWLPSYTSPEVQELMDELKRLSQIAYRHSIALSFRLNNKADSYLYWKSRMLKTIAATGAIGALFYNKNKIEDAFQASLDKVENVANLAKNLSKYIYYNTSSLANAAYNTSSSWGNSAYNIGTNFTNAALAKAETLNNYLSSNLTDFKSLRNPLTQKN